MKERMLDKCIKANFKMVGNEIGIASVMALVSVFCLLSLWLIPMLVISLPVTVIYMIKMYKKLFYTSVYGEMAVTYQGLPVPAKENVAAKIFVAGAGIIICNTAYIGVLFLTVISFSQNSTGLKGIFEVLAAAGNADMKYVLPLTAMEGIVGAFRIAALIFLTIAAFNSLNGEKKGLHRFLIITVAFAANVLIGNISMLITKLNIDNFFILSSINLIIGAAMIVLCFRLTVKLLEEKYELN
ncbi:MAG: hypothetical protein IKW01_04085 [Firmicutes bacterium]|nr:hypothetical protein [Bacillota bacterium]